MSVDEARVLWVKVEKPVFDLWGVLASSLLFTLIAVGVAALLGAMLGVALIRRNRRRERQGLTHSVRLDLELAAPPALGR